MALLSPTCTTYYHHTDTGTQKRNIERKIKSVGHDDLKEEMDDGER